MARDRLALVYYLTSLTRTVYQVDSQI